jgi:hypothetical protein
MVKKFLKLHEPVKLNQREYCKPRNTDIAIKAHTESFVFFNISKRASKFMEYIKE